MSEKKIGRFLFAVFRCTYKKELTIAQVKALFLRDRGLLSSRKLVATRALGRTCLDGNIELAEFLLDQGADPQAGVGCARYCAHVSVLRLLMDRGADIHALERHHLFNGGTGFHDAAQMASPELAEFLLAHGGKPHINVKLERGGEHGWGGWTALMIAARHKWGTRERSREVARLLLENGADYDIFSATALGDLKHVRRLLRRDRSLLRQTAGNGATLLHWAAEAGDVRCADLFMAAGIDVNVASNSRRTPLHFAAAMDRPDMVAFLIKSGATVDAQDDKGRTALHEATYQGSRAAADLLIARGASVRIRNKNRKTPLDVARKGCLDLRTKSRGKRSSRSSASHRARRR